jgi:hypothetical protein
MSLLELAGSRWWRIDSSRSLPPDHVSAELRVNDAALFVMEAGG